MSIVKYSFKSFAYQSNIKKPNQLKLFSPFHNFQIIWGFFQIKTLYGIFKILNWIVVNHKKYF